jgi:hypothetical protein
MGSIKSQNSLGRRAVIERNAYIYSMSGGHLTKLVLTGFFIHTCKLCSANPFDYLTELQKHAGELT